MSFFKKELVSSTSVYWIGLQITLAFIFLMLFVGVFLQLVGLPFNNFFGFWYADTMQNVRLVVVDGTLSVFILYQLFNERLKQTGNTTVTVSLAVSYLILITILVYISETASMLLIVLMFVLLPTIGIHKLLFAKKQSPLQIEDSQNK